MERDAYTQDYPDYDTPEPGYSEGAALCPPRKRSGKLSKEGERRKKARYRARHRVKWLKAHREYEARRRAEKRLAQGTHLGSLL